MEVLIKNRVSIHFSIWWIYLIENWVILSCHDHQIKRPIKYVVLIRTINQIFLWLFISWHESITENWSTSFKITQLPYCSFVIGQYVLKGKSNWLTGIVDNRKLINFHSNELINEGRIGVFPWCVIKSFDLPRNVILKKIFFVIRDARILPDTSRASKLNF